MNTTAAAQPQTQTQPQPQPIQPTQSQHPARELLSRYRAIFQHAWAHRAELAGPTRLADEVAFLPAALSLAETPVHPAPRRLAYGLMALFILALVWSYFGQVDIVAVAPGRIIVSERTKLIQPLEASIVKAVRVKDGDRVSAGQVLVELDPTMASADSASVQEQLHTQASEILRTRALLKALSNSQLSAPVLSGLEADFAYKPQAAQRLSIQAQLQSEWQDIRAKLAKLDAEANRHQAEMATVQASIAKLEATLPMAKAREADFTTLVNQGYISGHATQDKTRERVELERDLAVQRARLAEVQSTAQETEQAKAAYRFEIQRTLSERLAQATSRHSQLQADAAKASQRQRQTQLTAPVDGIVQQLAIHSVGGVVTSAQPLMIIVPDSPTVTAEVSIANQDIGFVNAGQMAAVKLETFAYTKYGTVEAKVDVVTADAVTDEKRGSYYPATLTLSQKDMLIDGKRVSISPGMNITAEIKTGKRRVIEYLLSPVQRAGSESLRER
ncbi:HlyD family type I secretion periplasmic adaptor subunit [Rhodoferax sp.]|uniref:HlyD family type I secretion periplasmic adaptor subunit n=1 Tax=Rhodoferax sp. TaxID=50421 RepID=UPI0026375150|nr:HlyD family type I secretion periplasmic adaptor subunit [Rhodoferax sp.]MDD2927150.1 HlyD family type I secretion periplasmic adaptor subunit [Rhodoferax sp.]